MTARPEVFFSGRKTIYLLIFFFFFYVSSNCDERNCQNLTPSGRIEAHSKLYFAHGVKRIRWWVSVGVVTARVRRSASGEALAVKELLRAKF